jgi:hypothetical protein
MVRQALRFRVVVASILMLALVAPSAFARGDERRGGRGDDRGYSRVESRGEHHYYRDGRWYRHGWFGFGIVVSALAIGALIDSLPPRHTTVVVENTPYYYDNTYYYRPLPQGGYVVVPPPPVVVAPPPVVVYPPETSTINIPNSRGGYTSVTLRRSGTGFVGPQGEYYASYPTVEQLKVMYGN